MEKPLTSEQVEVYADPKRSAVSLIYDLQGNVIGNSQHLARTALILGKVIDQLGTDLEKVLQNFEKNFEELE